MRNRALVTALIVCHISTTLNPSTEQWGQSSFIAAFLNSYATLFHALFAFIISIFFEGRKILKRSRKYVRNTNIQMRFQE